MGRIQSGVADHSLGTGPKWIDAIAVAVAFIAMAALVVVVGTHADALSGLRLARQLGIWFHRTYGKKPDFKPGPFVPPPEPVDATASLRTEIAALQAKLSASGDAVTAARREAEEHARAAWDRGLLSNCLSDISLSPAISSAHAAADLRSSPEAYFAAGPGGPDRRRASALM